MKTIPCCFFPTTVLMVDDNKEYLSNLQLLLNSKLLTRIETNPNDALPIVNNYHLSYSIVEACIEKFNSYELDNDLPLSKINLENLINISLNKNRFSYISVLVVDYSMPQMTGIDLCNKLKDIPISKIMVTGEADLDIAVDAFNKGIINKFIVKGSPNFKEILQSAIQQFQKELFQNISYQIISKIKENLWHNKAFIKFFSETKEKLNATEYYMIDSKGSFLFLDENGKATILAVKSATEINNYYNIALDNGSPNNITSSLKNLTHFPLLLEEKHIKCTTNEWGNLLHEAQLIPGLNDTYYAIINCEQNNNYFLNYQWHGINNYNATNQYRVCI